MSGRQVKRARRESGISTQAKRDESLFRVYLSAQRHQLEAEREAELLERIDSRRRWFAIVGIVLWLAALAALGFGVR